MFLGPGEKPPKAPRKSGRSTSPRAVELRRLQNRVSQRKHRLNIRKASKNTEEKSASDAEASQWHSDSSSLRSTVETSANDTLDHMTTPSSVPLPTPATPPSQTMIMAEDLLECDPSHQYNDSLSTLPKFSENDNAISQSSFTPPTCNCSSTAISCPSHLEMPYDHITADSNMSFPLMSMPDMTLPLSSVLSFSPYSHPSPPFLSNNIFSCDSISGNTSSSSSEASSAQAGLRVPSGSSQGLGMTPRFGMVLEAIGKTGFQDFEEMVVAFYTSQFEWGSMPAMVQCVSRSRRLKTMLHTLQKSSSMWPRRESRGLHESISEAAASLYIEEMERVVKAPVASPSQSDMANLISGLEWLLRDSGFIIQSHARTTENDPSLPEQVEAALDSVSQRLGATNQWIHEGLTT